MSAAPVRVVPVEPSAHPARPASPAGRPAVQARALAPARPRPAPARPAAPQPGLFEDSPYRVARPRTRPARTSPFPSIGEARDREVRAVSVAAPDHRSVVGFVAMCVTVVLASLVAVLLLNITMTERAYEQRDLTLDLARLQEERVDLITAIESHGAPQNLAAAAEALGMVPATSVGFVELSTGDVTEPAGGR